MEATNRIHGFSSCFPTRFSTIFAAIDTFMRDEEWSKYIFGLDELRKQTGVDEMVRPITEVVVVGVIGVIGLVLLALLQYTFQVILTLAVVESPAIPVPVDSKKPVAVLGMNTPPKYVTSTLSGSIKHIQDSAGWFAAWRGWNIHVVYLVALALMRSFLGDVLGSISEGISRPIAGVVSLLVLGQVAMVSTHIIISKPQKKNWFIILCSTKSRIILGRSISAMVPFALAQTLAAELCNYGVNNVKMIFFLSGVLVSIFVTFPCMVALIRVQASLLPKEQDAVVSFDRSFGVEGIAVISFKQALSSVGRAGWKRIYGVAIKAAIILAGVSATIGIVVGVGMTLVVGPISFAEGRQSLIYMASISLLEFFGTLR
ncbi:hypothetical protein Q9L58_000297 [Maublancomyces gigas]|uniref:Uncharacterized protein n=1 Tax=Discina gigas TaxID=1032678 RepID=A0ABR3GXT9_9PEZI